MTDSKIQKKAIDTMVIMNTAITNLRLYPPSSAMISNTVDRLYQVLSIILEEEESLIFAESEKNLLICGQLLNQKDQEKPQVISFLEVLLDFGIKSVTFEKRLDKAELIAFLEILSKKPEEVEKEGDLQKVMEDKGLPHILLDQKVYVAKDKDQQILASLDIKDEQIIKYVTGADPTSDIDLQKVKEMARDTEWISRVFQSGMKHITEQSGTTPDIKLSESVIHMIRTLDSIADDEDKGGISQQVAGSIADMDIEVISTILTQKMEGLLNDKLFDDIVNQIDDDKFKRLVLKVTHMQDMATDEDATHGSSENELVNQAYESLMNSNRGKQLRNEIKEERAREKEEKEQEIAYFKDKVNLILEGDDETFLNKEMMQSLPDIIEQLFAKEENQTAAEMIDKLADKLLSENPDVRVQVSETLLHIVDSLTDEQRTDTMNRLSDKLVNWIKLETSITPAYEQICIQLQNLAHTLIRNHQFAESGPILEVFNLINSGKLEKDEAIKAISGNVMREIAIEDLLDILFKEFLSNEQNKRKEASHNLANIGAAPVNRLLDILRESQDGSERVRVLQLISEIGHHAVPALIERIEQDGTWYYVRNLVLLLGRIGSEENVEVLRPFLNHEDFRVQRETLKSINTIGRDRRGEILLSALPVSDERLKVSIIDTLGSLKYHDAVFPLLELLKSKSFISSKTRTELEEKICIALGRIGSEEAIPALMAIAEQKGLLRRKSYDTKVKIAAGRALAMINKR